MAVLPVPTALSPLASYLTLPLPPCRGLEGVCLGPFKMLQKVFDKNTTITFTTLRG